MIALERHIIYRTYMHIHIFAKEGSRSDWGLPRPEAASQNSIVYPRALNRQLRRAARQDKTLALVLPPSLLKITQLSLSTLLCRRRHHASEVQQLFSTRSLSDVS
jgi:hypothetical protein